LAVTPDEQLRALIETYAFTSAELAFIFGCSLRAIETRRAKLRNSAAPHRQRRSKVDEHLDQLYGLATRLHAKHIAPPLVRAFFLGRSLYLDEQRPGAFLARGHFELVRSAALAFAHCQDPFEFIEEIGSVPRLEDPDQVLA
jgi:hypothetical protein